MTLDTSIIRISELHNELYLYFTNKFKVSQYELDILQNSIDHYLKPLRNDLWVHIEYPYTDKVFRDSYYHYFSSKSTDYHRHCIRIALFDSEIYENDFRVDSKDKSLLNILKKKLRLFCN